MGIHNTHLGLVENNIVVDWQGGGIVTEDGSETGNVIQANFVGSGGAMTIRSRDPT